MERMEQPISAADLLRMGNDDVLLPEEMSLCTVCTGTCSVTAAQR
jgi:hypothetical protein